MHAGRILATAAGFGFAGWLLETALYPNRPASRRSRLWSLVGVPESISVPLLPTYAVGGAALAVLAPIIRRRHLKRFDRLATWAAVTTAIELLACQLDRGTGGAAWDYSATSDGTGPCVDLPHSLSWAVLAMAAERFV